MHAGLVVNIIPDYNILSTRCDWSSHSKSQPDIESLLQELCEEHSWYIVHASRGGTVIIIIIITVIFIILWL